MTMNVEVNKEDFVKQQRALMTDKLREKIKKRDNYTCQCCGNSIMNEPSLLLEVDHIIPVSKGGLTREDNLQTLCWKCNRSKGSKVGEDVPEVTQTYAKSLDGFLEMKNKQNETVELKRKITYLKNQLLEFSSIDERDIGTVFNYWIGDADYNSLSSSYLNALAGVAETLEHYYNEYEEEINKNKEEHDLLLKKEEVEKLAYLAKVEKENREKIQREQALADKKRKQKEKQTKFVNAIWGFFCSCWIFIALIMTIGEDVTNIGAGLSCACSGIIFSPLVQGGFWKRCGLSLLCTTALAFIWTILGL